MSMRAALNREKIRRFNSYWEDLMEEFPEARAKAVETMGRSVKRDLDAQIGRADLEADAKGMVRSWQELRFGSKGGYAAVTAKKGSLPGTRPKRWKGKPVSMKQVTRWLERGHGTPSARQAVWNFRWKTKTNRKVAQRKGVGYVKGRMFYSWTRRKALEHALDAANEAMELFAEQKGV